MKLLIPLSLLLALNSAQATKPSVIVEPEQTQEQIQIQEQTQANEQNMSFNGVRQANSAIAPSLFSNNPCYVAGSGALGLKNINIGGGKSFRDSNCEKIMAAQAFMAAQELELAVKMVCATEAAIEVLGDACTWSGNPDKAVRELRDEVRELKAANTRLLAVRDVDQRELETMREKYLKCDSDGAKLEEQCTK